MHPWVMELAKLALRVHTVLKDLNQLLFVKEAHIALMARLSALIVKQVTTVL
jgi:hypothetical protein